MNHLAIYTLTSELHDREAVGAATRTFLAGLGVDYDFRDNDYADYGTHALDVIYVRTGGTEGVFLKLLPLLTSRSQRPFYLLTSGQSNSLAASMEILSYLRQQGLRGEIIHGSAPYVARRLGVLTKAGVAQQRLSGLRLGVIGEPSDWLIASRADAGAVKAKLGIDLVSVAMSELLEVIASTPLREVSEACADEAVRASLPGACQIYDALRVVIDRHALQGFTLRCFNLLSAVRNTGCLALARLNAEGIVAGCEGDVPAMLSMAMAQALTGVSGFQANPARIDAERGEIVFAHCTIPLDMTMRYELDTHFESGLGVGIRGYMAEGPVTIFKVSGDLSRHFIAEGELVSNGAEPGLCRTQQLIRLADASLTTYFTTNPIGNHHIIMPGHWREELDTLTR